MGKTLPRIVRAKEQKKGFVAYDVDIPCWPRPACATLVVPENAEPRSLPLVVEFCGADLSADMKKALGPNGGRYPMEFIRENVEQCVSNDLTWDLTGLGKDEVPTREAWEAAMSVIKLCKSTSS